MSNGVPMTLETRRLSVSYGGVRALTNVDVTVEPGKLLGLIGPNGAGKTTFIDAVTGFATSSGKVLLAGDDVSSLPPHERARRGLARTWQSADLFGELTVRENVAVAARRPRAAEVARQLLTGRARRSHAVEETIALLGLERLADRRCDELTHGQRKLVGIARALSAQGGLVCLDEPAAGLDAAESELLAEHLRELTRQGRGMLLVDHDMRLVLSSCDHVVVLNFGEVIASGSPEVVRRDRRVIDAYLGAAGDVSEAADG